MAFTLKNPPYIVDNTPIYRVDMEDGVMGKANNNGSIVINKDLDPSEVDDVVSHEKVHLDQMKRGDLDYDNENVYWKGKKYSRASMKEGAKNLPWEKEAYEKG
jgi:hypothetical protein|tara:strand:- start:251 stop:559 length:309 start_codon:yes stop_codon:yes gene_type:complete